MKKMIALLMLSAVLLSGSANEPDFPGPDYLITKVEITCDGDFPRQRVFEDPESMDAILIYLRNVPILPAEHLPAVENGTPVYHIRLTHSTGRVTLYHQIGDCYLSKNGSSWHPLDPEQGGELIRLYHHLPAKNPAANAAGFSYM